MSAGEDTAPVDGPKRSFAAGVRNAAGWAVALSCALAISFTLVALLLPKSNAYVATPQELQQVAQLRSFTNELFGLLDEFSRQEATLGQTRPAAFERWSENRFRSRVNELRHRLINFDFSHETVTALLLATDRAVALAAYPHDARAWRAAQAAALEASNLTDFYVAQLNAEGLVDPSPFAPSL